MKRRLVFTGMIFLIPVSALCQNLITNPGFETGAWASANSGSPDWLTGPTNIFGTEPAHGGTRYMGESMGQSPVGGPTDFREYIKSPLSAALIPGNMYVCSIWVSLSENYGDYACNRIGFATTTTSPSFGFSNGPIPLTPVYATPTIITNKNGWTLLSGTFVATTADTWVTIGNFNTQAGTSWVYVGAGMTFYYGYYFMDDVCLGPPGSCTMVVLPVELLSFSGKAENKTVALSWITAAEINCDYFILERSNDGKSFEQIAEIDASGNSNEKNEYAYIDDSPVLSEWNYYRLKEVDFDGNIQFSEIVSIDPDGDNDLSLLIYPVPAYDEVTLQFPLAKASTSLLVYNSIGSLVLTKDVGGESSAVVNALPAGTYLAVLTHNGQLVSKKFIIEATR
ncbi:MAG: T9SS type A sorting domain-containing protein [Flavobacteriales bacterium]